MPADRRQPKSLAKTRFNRSEQVEILSIFLDHATTPVQQNVFGLLMADAADIG
jgi:hypothetical protein